MQLYVAITDQDWFDYLSANAPEEVNFWRPGGTPFRALQPGELFLFKPHRENYVMGGGFFSHYTPLPVSYAWKVFGVKNGAQTEAEMRARIEQYRRIAPQPAEDYSIGCIVLLRPFFLRRSDWFVLPEWKRGIQQGWGFDVIAEPGRALWTRAMQAANAQPDVCSEPAMVEAARFGQPQLVLPRLGQGSFRVVVTDAYQRRCAFTGSPVLPTLEAAHIRPYSSEGPHALINGLLLRQDLHTLFDRGYLTVTSEHRVEVSKRIHDEFENGKDYYALHGADIRVPEDQRQRPGRDFLAWHNQHVFRG